MKTCEGCPNRLVAMLAEEIGAEQTARTAREVGCTWWQSLPVTDPNGQPDIVEGCMRQNLRQYLAAYGIDIRLAADTVQKDRNEQREALQAVEAAFAEHGAGAVLQALGRLGLRAAIGASAGGESLLESGPASPAPGLRTQEAATEESGS